MQEETPDISRRRDAEALTDLACCRYALPVLAELAARTGAKGVTLASAVGASRASVRRALDALIDAGYAAPNPGYGHPMRPEYVLTDRGRAAGEPARRILRAADHLGARDAALHKWSLPVVLVTHPRAETFSAIRDTLTNPTDRAVSLTLKRLVEAAVLDRNISEGFPPRPRYALTRRARSLHAPVRALAQIARAA
jgi:DNA-binding HxlR family transcriptional regulator